MKSIFIILLFPLLMFNSCLASEELRLPLCSADVRFPKGRVEIKSPRLTVQSLKISAFDKSIEIPANEFKKLEGIMYSEINVSSASGHSSVGGNQIYITLTHQDMYGGDPFKGDRMQEERVTITISENGSVQIKKVRLPVAQP